MIYYFLTYIKNGEGAGYGDVMSFTTVGYHRRHRQLYSPTSLNSYLAHDTNSSLSS